MSALQDRLSKAVDKFEYDLGFTAPELLGMRIGQLRQRLAGIAESLDGFLVGGFDDEGGQATEPVRIWCTECSTGSPFMTNRDDGGADYTTPLDDLAAWALDHECDEDGDDS